MLIVMDAGYGGKDSGAAAHGLLEKDITLKLALKAGAYLKANYDCDVIYTRTKDVYLTPSERAQLANQANADFFCSFHINSFNETSHGFETFCYPGAKGKTITLQRTVHEEVMKVLKSYNITNRGMKQKNFAVVRETKMPALLTETLFISNPNEAKLLKSEMFLNQIAEAHAIGLAQAAGLKNGQPTYYLMTGTFKTKAEAEKHAEMLKERYGWIVQVKKS